MARTIDQILGEYRGPLRAGQDYRRRTRPLTQVPGDQIRLIGHHSVSRTIGSIEAEFKSDNRELGGNFGMGPINAGRDEYISRQYVDWRNDMAFCTASSWDDTSIVGEIADLELAYPWPIGTTGLNLFAELAAAMHIELGMPLDTEHVVDHLYVFQNGPGSYATQCAGDFFRARIRDYVIPLALKIVAEHHNPAPEEELMRRFAFRDDRDRKLPKGQWITVYLNDKNDASFASGQCLGLVNAYLQVSGLPVGEGLKVRLMKTKVGTSEERGAIAAREVPGTTGTTYATVPFDFQLDRPDDGVRVQIAADSDGVTLLRGDISGLVQ